MSLVEYRLIFAGVLMLGIFILHAQQVQMLADSLGEYWKRKGKRATQSKILFLLSLLSCMFALVSPFVAIIAAAAFFVPHAILAMSEFR